MQIERGLPQNPELTMTPEKPNPKYDALLVHGYWLTEKTIKTHQKDGTVTKKQITAPALRTHFAARAAALAWDEGRGAGKILIDLGSLWGPNYPTEGKIIADTLMNKYHVPQEAIILRETAYSSYGEVKTALELAKENGWTKIMDVAFSAHHLTIPAIYKSKELESVRPTNLQVDYRSIESILEKDDRRVASVRRKLAGLTKRGLNFALRYRAYEIAKWLYMHKPGFKYEPLEEMNRLNRTKPDKEWKWRIDKYNLPEEKPKAI